MSKPRRSREELRESLVQSINALRATADEMATMFEGADDPTWPHGPQVFRDWVDFVDRCARPLVEAYGSDGEMDDAAEQAAMALYRQVSPYYICTCMVMMANRIERAS